MRPGTLHPLWMAAWTISSAITCVTKASSSKKPGWQHQRHDRLGRQALCHSPAQGLGGVLPPKAGMLVFAGPTIVAAASADAGAATAQRHANAILFTFPDWLTATPYGFVEKSPKCTPECLTTLDPWACCSRFLGRQAVCVWMPSDGLGVAYGAGMSLL